MNKYEDNLINKASALDAATNSYGKMIRSARRIVSDENESSLVLLYNNATSFSKSDDSTLAELAKSVINSIIILLGYKRLKEIIVEHNRIDSEEDKTLEQLLQELNSLVGLREVKDKVNDLIAYHSVQLLRKSRGLAMPNKTLHMAFMGNPGTGKTTVARIVGRIYKQLGLLSKGHFIEVSRTDLIAGYQGQTALKVKKVIDKAKGGVLFIDEAYSLTENDHTDSYGRECLTELTKALEDYRNDLVVIVAGYTDLMKNFFSSNPGLKSRFNTFIEFVNYDAEELFEILTQMCNNDDYKLADACGESIKTYLNEVTKSYDADFANGRFVRNIYEEMIMRQSKRLMGMEKEALTTEDLRQLTVDDLPLSICKYAALR